MQRIFLTLLFWIVCSPNAFALILDLKGWEEKSGKHFKVFFKREIGEDEPRQILNRAEELYSAIADHIGYARYQNFWTWEERVPIVYFSSQQEFMRVTSRPMWSKGFSVSHLASVNFRMIVTFKGQEDFLKSTLPHEVSHLILHDFIGPNRTIPLWFDEGVAQLEEVRDDQNIKILAQLVSAGQDIPLSVLQNFDSKQSLDARAASIFYAESLYIVDFLVKTYGKEGFVNLCRYLRDGKSFEESLRRAYYPALDSVVKLQDAWGKYIVQQL